MATTNGLSMTTATQLATSGIVRDAVRALCSVSEEFGRHVITLPIVTATGSQVAVTVWSEGSGNSFMVSDDGVAHFEISSGAFSENVFRSVAKRRSHAYGAHFDGQAMLYLRIDRARLEGAIMAIGNLVKEVIDETIEKCVAQKAKRIDSELLDRLTELFPKRVVERPHFQGASTADHQFLAMIEGEGRPIVFDTFSSQGSSVNSIIVKMADVAGLEGGPQGVAVTRVTADIGPKLNLLWTYAKVLEIGAANDRYRNLLVA